MQLRIIVDYPCEYVSVLDDLDRELFGASRDEDLLDDFAEDLRTLLEMLENSVTMQYVEHQPDDVICGNCSGSGEGMYEGTSCYVCHGKGSVFVE